MNGLSLAITTTAILIHAAAYAQGNNSASVAVLAATDLSAVPLESLRSAYLSCHAIALQKKLSPKVGPPCARVSSELLLRGFGGKREALLQWRAAAVQTHKYDALARVTRETLAALPLAK